MLLCLYEFDCLGKTSNGSGMTASKHIWRHHLTQQKAERAEFMAITLSWFWLTSVSISFFFLNGEIKLWMTSNYTSALVFKIETCLLFNPFFSTATVCSGLSCLYKLGVQVSVFSSRIRSLLHHFTSVSFLFFFLSVYLLSTRILLPPHFSPFHRSLFFYRPLHPFLHPAPLHQNHLHPSSPHPSTSPAVLLMTTKWISHPPFYPAPWQMHISTKSDTNAINIH